MSAETASHEAAPHETVSVKIYLRVFIALLVLLVITVAVAFIPTGSHRYSRDLLTAVGFLIAGAKATLIILWFMHVKTGTRMTWLFASAAFVWLLIMFGLTFNDYVTREDLPGAEKEAPHITEASGVTQEFKPVTSPGPRQPR